jgi:hypothetical protein
MVVGLVGYGKRDWVLPLAERSEGGSRSPCGFSIYRSLCIKLLGVSVLDKAMILQFPAAKTGS